MKKRITLIISLLTITCGIFAQVPKGISKIQKAIVSLNTYDKNGDLLNSGTAFYIGTNGEAIADYTLFKNAYKASIIDMSGKQADVDCILGADDTYSIVRFRVKTKGNAVLNCTSTNQQDNTQVFAVPYTKDKLKNCANTTIESQTPVNEKYSYYTLSTDLGNEMVGCPLLNENGELIGIIQSSIKEKGYALDIRFREELAIKAISTSSATMALNNIHIAKDIPESVEEALVYTYFKSRSTDNNEYLDILDRFITRFPNNAEGYLRRCTPYIDILEFDKADADLNKYLSLATDKGAANYNAAQTIYNKLVYQKEPVYERWTFDYAISLIDKSIDIYKDDTRKCADSKILKAQILSANKNYNNAIKVYEDLSSTKETSSPAILYAMSMACEQRGDSTSAIIALLDSAINMFGEPLPGDAANYVLRRGRLYAQIEKYRNAVKDYDQYCYLVNNKVSDIFYYDKSQMELKGRLYQQAYDDINSALTIAPNNIVYLVEKAAMCLRFGHNEECIEACNKALQINDKDTDAIRILGFAQLQDGKKELGRETLKKAIELGDENAKDILEKYGK